MLRLTERWINEDPHQKMLLASSTECRKVCVGDCTEGLVRAIMLLTSESVVVSIAYAVSWLQLCFAALVGQHLLGRRIHPPQAGGRSV